MFDFSQLFLYVPGIVIFLVGSSSVRLQLRRNKLGACVEASVVSCAHVLKKDNQDRVTMNYYNVVVEYYKGRNRERETVRSPNEYSVGQQVKLFRNKDKLTLMQEEEQSIFSPWATTIGGALLLLMALLENKGQEILAMLTLAVVLIGAGGILLYTYFNLKKKNLVELQGEVIDVFRRQISKETKILRDSKFTYYPIVSYELEGKKCIRRCNVNSSYEKAYQVGDPMTLYYDPKERRVAEQKAKLSIAIWGGVLLAIGLLAGTSILSVLI